MCKEYDAQEVLYSALVCGHIDKNEAAVFKVSSLTTRGRHTNMYSRGSPHRCCPPAALGMRNKHVRPGVLICGCWSCRPVK